MGGKAPYSRWEEPRLVVKVPKCKLSVFKQGNFSKTIKRWA